MQLDPENVEALVALAIMDLHTNEGMLCPQYCFPSDKHRLAII